MIKGIWLIVTHHSGNELNVYGWTTNLLIFARRNRAHVMIARQQSGWSWMSWDPLVCIIKSIILFHFFFCVLFFSILLCLVLFYSLQFNSISPEILFFCGFPILLYAVHTHMFILLLYWSRYAKRTARTQGIGRRGRKQGLACATWFFVGAAGAEVGPKTRPMWGTRPRTNLHQSNIGKSGERAAEMQVFSVLR